MWDSKMPDPESNPGPGPIDIHIGGRAAERRQALGLAIGDVAQTLGVDGACLHQLEGGQQRFAARQLWKLSRRLQVPMAWFFKTSGDAPKAPQPKARTAEPSGAQMVFVPNPDLDRSGDGEPIPIH